MTELKPTDMDECYGDIIIEMLTGGGVPIEGQVYSYFCNARGYDEDGWYNDQDQLIGGDEVEDVFFPAGTGFWVTGVAGTTWGQAGQVYEADKSIPLADDKQMLCNPYATSIFLGRDISVGECDECYGDVIIEMLTSGGVPIEGQVYSWFCNARGYDEDGWYNDQDQLIGGEEVDDVEFTSGTGLWVTGVDGYTFDITSPLK